MQKSLCCHCWVRGKRFERAPQSTADTCVVACQKDPWNAERTH
jgi:hypothetical protein